MSQWREDRHLLATSGGYDWELVERGNEVLRAPAGDARCNVGAEHINKRKQVAAVGYRAVNAVGARRGPNVAPRLRLCLSAR